MKYCIGSIILFFFTIQSVWAVATESSEYRQFQKIIVHMISLGKQIDRAPENPLRDRLIYQRQALFDRAESLRNTFQWNRLTATLDVSHVYDFVIQKYKLSCEIAAVKMVMESLTPRKISEDEIFAELRQMPEPLSRDGIWGDPDIGFVGSITGSQNGKTGYGIHEKPLKKYLEKKWYTVTIPEDNEYAWLTPKKRLISLLDTLSEGYRIVLWWDWCTLPEKEDGIVRSIDTYIAKTGKISAQNPCARSEYERYFSWKTPSGKIVQWLAGEHVFLLLGYIGDRANPTHIVIWDTDTGKHIYPIGEWMRKWWAMQYRYLKVSIE